MCAYKRHHIFYVFIVPAFLIITAISSSADSLTYTYDDLNRLTKILFQDSSFITYTYDDVGNRLSQIPTPVTAVSLSDSGYYFSDISVTLSCSDMAGPGCDKIYFTTDGSTPTTSSSVYTGPITISESTILIYFSKDTAGNTEPVQSKYYKFLPVEIKNSRTSTVYPSLQAAYDSAISGDTIQVQAGKLSQNLTVNRDISITLSGGYDPDYSYYAGYTSIKGMIQTQPGGGSMTIKNFLLTTQ